MFKYGKMQGKLSFRLVCGSRGACLDSTLFGVQVSREILNQARAGQLPTRAWFLKIDPVRMVNMCVSAPEPINN